MPKNGLGIMDLSTGTVTRIEKVKSFPCPRGWIRFYRLLIRSETRRETECSGRRANSVNPCSTPRTLSKEKRIRLRTRPAKHRHQHRTQVQRRARLHDQQRRQNTRSSPPRRATKKPTVSTQSKPTAAMDHRSHCSAAKASIKNSPGTKTTRKSLSSATRKTPPRSNRSFASITGTAKIHKPRRSSPISSPGFRKDLVVSESANLSFSLDGSRLFLGSAPPPEPEKNPDEEIPADEKVLVDLWHWKDDYVQPIQKVRAEQDRNRSYRAVYDLKEKKFVQLADETMENVSPSNDGRYAIGSDNRKFRIDRRLRSRIH